MRFEALKTPFAVVVDHKFTRHRSVPPDTVWRKRHSLLGIADSTHSSLRCERPSQGALGKAQRLHCLAECRFWDFAACASVL